MILWQVDRDPWRTIAEHGQFRTWLRVSQRGLLEGSNGRVLVRHSVGSPAASWAGRVDAWNSRMRWHPDERVRRVNRWVELGLGFPARWWVPSRRGPHEWLGQPAWHFTLADIHLLWRWKFVATLRAALEHPFSWLFFTTASSYVRVGRLLAEIDALPRGDAVYAGSIAQHRGFRFISGARRLLSRDVVERFVAESRDLGNSRYEDVEFEVWARSRGIAHRPLSAGSTINLESRGDVDRLTGAEIADTSHFRCKSLLPDGRRDDVQVMLRLHERVKSVDPRA